MTQIPRRLRAGLLTPYGTGAMAVLRIVGPGASDLLDQVFRPINGKSARDWHPNQLHYGQLHDDGEPIDDAVACLRSIRDDEQIIEATVHAGIRIVERALLAVSRHGANVQPATDLQAPAAARIEHEIMHALTSAQTKQAVRFLALQRLNIVTGMHEIADQLDRHDDSGRRELVALRERSGIARFLIEGATIALVGPVNAGKSTLINRMAPESRSLVSDLPGTTRDWVAVDTVLEGFPIRFIDTAGFRHAPGALEQDAIERAARQARTSTLQIIVLDGTAPLSDDSMKPWQSAFDRSNVIIVLNKSDLPCRWTRDDLRRSPSPPTRTSGLTGDGVDELKEAICDRLGIHRFDPNRPSLFTTDQIGRLEALLSDESNSQIGEALRCEFLNPF